MDATKANQAMAQLRVEAPKAAPFFLQVGFEAPHVTNDYEFQYEGMFAGERVPRVPGFDEQDISDKPRYIRQDKPPLAQQTNRKVSTVCKDNELNSIEQNDCEYVRQLRNLQTVDRFVKNAVDYLASQGELSSTYIVYYTDNGNHWGEHRLDFGKLSPYETDTGFPLLIRGPNIPAATTSNKLVGNQDIAPTFAQIAGATAPSFVDGRSILRVADSSTTNDAPWRTALYAERRWNTEWTLPSKASPEYVPPWEAIREENLVYIRYGDDPWTAVKDEGFKEFYDLTTDPYQNRNLAYYREVSQTTLDRLNSRLERLRGCVATACRSAENEVIK
jgi:N-acetylglucosamine-6-sulfatase